MHIICLKYFTKKQVTTVSNELLYSIAIVTMADQ